jgi:hypothetical protein
MSIMRLEDLPRFQAFMRCVDRAVTRLKQEPLTPAAIDAVLELARGRDELAQEPQTHTGRLARAQ